jgi:hypothetical protein
MFFDCQCDLYHLTSIFNVQRKGSRRSGAVFLFPNIAQLAAVELWVPDVLSVACGLGHGSCRYWKSSVLHELGGVIRFATQSMRERSIFTILLIHKFRPESMISRLPIDLFKVCVHQ